MLEMAMATASYACHLPDGAHRMGLVGASIVAPLVFTPTAEVALNCSLAYASGLLKLHTTLPGSASSLLMTVEAGAVPEGHAVT
jgi:hypothetical protein